MSPTAPPKSIADSSHEQQPQPPAWCHKYLNSVWVQRLVQEGRRRGIVVYVQHSKLVPGKPTKGDKAQVRGQTAVAHAHATESTAQGLLFPATNRHSKLPQPGSSADRPTPLKACVLLPAACLLARTQHQPQVGWFDDATGQWDGTSLETVEGQRLARIMQDSWQLYPKPYVNCPLVEKLLVPLQKVSLDTTAAGAADASTHTNACVRADSSSNPQQTDTGCAGKAAAWYTSAPAQLYSSTVAGLQAWIVC